MEKPKIIIVSGYFNPLHKGHIELFEKAKTKGDQLWVIVNSDFQREIKGSKFFMNQEERLIIIKSIVFVDKALISLDKDNTQCSTLSFLSSKYSSKYDIIFANGGDQKNSTIPELSICKKFGIELVEGLGDKIQSSSWLLNN